MAAGDWKDMFGAACAGDEELVRHHLRNGVDVNFSHAEYQSTALVASIAVGQERIAHVLLDHGADPNLESVLEGQTPLQAARQQQMTSVVNRLLELGARPRP
jgi:ankyrin repeat protein